MCIITWKVLVLFAEHKRYTHQYCLHQIAVTGSPCHSSQTTTCGVYCSCLWQLPPRVPSPVDRFMEQVWQQKPSSVNDCALSCLASHSLCVGRVWLSSTTHLEMLLYTAYSVPGLWVPGSIAHPVVTCDVFVCHHIHQISDFSVTNIWP